MVADASKGVNTITLAIDRKLFKDSELRVQLLDGKRRKHDCGWGISQCLKRS